MYYRPLCIRKTISPTTLQAIRRRQCPPCPESSPMHFTKETHSPSFPSLPFPHPTPPQTSDLRAFRAQFTRSRVCNNHGQERYKWDHWGVDWTPLYAAAARVDKGEPGFISARLDSTLRRGLMAEGILGAEHISRICMATHHCSYACLSACVRVLSIACQELTLVNIILKMIHP